MTTQTINHNHRTAIHVLQKNHNNTCEENQNTWFKISYSIVAPSGGADKYLNVGCTITNHLIAYIKPPKLFLKCTV